MGLLPIEFKDCFVDSPYFRSNIQAHERELDQTSSQIKTLVREIKDLVAASKTLSKAQRNFANSLSNFSFECIGGSQTDNEIIIAGSLKEFGRYLSLIEDERDRVLERVATSFINPIEKFRREQIGGVKDGKKKFEKETTKFCQSLERHLNLSTKKSENHLQEADASLEMEQRYFMKASLEYVCKLQEVQERKKFEFVETILSFMYGWMTFYHQGHEVAREFKSFMTDLQIILQRTRENYETTQNETDNLMKKMLEDKSTRSLKSPDLGSVNKMYTRQGYLFLMEKKAFGTTWTKVFCQYQKENRLFIMIPYNQTFGKIGNTETITLKECVRRLSDSIEKRFCFDVISDSSVTYTLQALSEEDRKLWFEAMEAISNTNKIANSNCNSTLNNDSNLNSKEEYVLDYYGLEFIKQLTIYIENQGLEDQGLYRVSGVSSKITKLMRVYQENYKNFLALNYESYSNDYDSQNNYINDNKIITSVENVIREFSSHDLKTVTSALKNYLRNLPEPLMTFRLHSAFINAAKIEQKEKRVNAIHELVHNLPKINFQMCKVLIEHLNKVSEKAEKNLMNICNLGVCFGPTLLRPEEESVAAIMNIKFCNVVVEILIGNYEKIFNTKPFENSLSKMNFNSFNNLSSNINSNVQLSIGLPSQQIIPHFIQQPSINVMNTFNRLPNTNSLNQSNYRHPNQVSPTNFVNQNNSFNSNIPNQQQINRHLVYPSFNNNLGMTLPEKPNNFNRPVGGIYNNWNNNSANNLNLMNNYQVNNFISFNNIMKAVPATVQTQPILSQQATALPPTNPSSNFYVSYNSNPGCNLSNNSGNTTSSTSSVVPAKPPAIKNNNLLNTFKNLSIDVNPPVVNCSSSSSASSANSNNLSLSTSNSAINTLESSGNKNFNSPTDNSTNSVNTNHPKGRKVKSLYACVGGESSELSFAPNVIIHDVHPSHESGWLIGKMANGKIGLIPENYVKYID